MKNTTVDMRRELDDEAARTLTQVILNALDNPDDVELGRQLLRVRIASEAYMLGYGSSNIPSELIAKLRPAIAAQEAEKTGNIVFEKALRKAAMGHFEQAGKILREHLNDAAIASKQIEIGLKFTQGRKANSVSVIRKAIVKLIAKNPDLKNPDIWDAISQKPPRQWRAFDSPRLGKYLEGPNNASMKYGRFCNVCGEERKKIRVKITD